MRGKTAGFTLVEIMIVLGIVGVLSSVAMPTFSRYKEQIRDVEASQMLSGLHSGAVSYFADEFISSNALAGAESITKCTARGGFVPDLATTVAGSPDGAKFALDFSADPPFEDGWKALGLDRTGFYFHAYGVMSGNVCYQVGGAASTATEGATMYVFIAVRKAPKPGTYQIGVVHEAHIDGVLHRSAGVDWYREIPESEVMNVLSAYNPPGAS